MNTAKSLFLIAILPFAASRASAAGARPVRWTEQKANEWYTQQPWLVGSNYIPRSAINELEMWQEATFNPEQINEELGWAESLGMNTMRVFLHDLLWQQDAEGFKKRIDQFLTIAAKHHIRPLFVLFDSCWDPLPHSGPQHPPIPGVHNSGWVQSPGAAGLADPKQFPRLKAYVEGVVGAFAKDDRILGWDICTEFMARSVGSTFDTILPIAKEEKVGAINWGFVAGKTQTNLPWESWEHPYIQNQPPVWFHEVLHPDGKPYRQAEADLIRELTGKPEK